MQTIDWKKTGFPEIPVWLAEIASTDAETRRTALDNLTAALVPWEILDGFVKSNDLNEVVKTKAQVKIIPYIIEMLEKDTILDKHLLLELLEYLLSFKGIEANYPNVDQAWFRQFGQEIHDAVLAGKPLYEKLLHSEDAYISETAQELLNRL